MVVRFLARCFLAVVVFFLLLAAFDFVFSKVAERANYQPVEIWHDVLGGTVDADVVALGNSLVTVGFNTEYMDSVLGVRTYALGFSGSQFDRQSYMYSLYRAKNRPPKVVVNFIDHNAMSLTTRVPNRDQFFPLFFNKDFRKAVFPVENFSWAERYIPMWRWHSYGTNKFLSRSPRHFRSGFKYITSTRTPFTTGARDSMRFGSDIEVLSPLWDKYLSENVKDGIRTVFVFPPLYKNNHFAEGYEELMTSTFNDFTERYGIRFLDYRSLPIVEDSTCFRDPFHLNGKGSIAFCDTLAKDLRQLGLI